MDAGQWGKLRRRVLRVGKGHVLLWTEWGNPEDRPLWGRREEIAERFGEARADWMLSTRGICACTRTSTSWTSSDRRSGISARSRSTRPRSRSTASPRRARAPRPERARIRQYEDFFASGMATPDDLEEFRSCQKTYLAAAAPWNDMSRGARHWIEGGDEEAKKLGLDLIRPESRPRTRVVHHPAQLLAAGNAEGGPGRSSAEQSEHGHSNGRADSNGARTAVRRNHGDDLARDRAFLYREARYLDDREFDKWLECYAPTASSGCRPGMTTTPSSPTLSGKSP